MERSRTGSNCSRKWTFIQGFELIEIACPRARRIDQRRGYRDGIDFRHVGAIKA